MFVKYIKRHFKQDILRLNFLQNSIFFLNFQINLHLNLEKYLVRFN